MTRNEDLQPSQEDTQSLQKAVAALFVAGTVQLGVEALAGGTVAGTDPITTFIVIGAGITAYNRFQPRDRSDA